MFTQRQRYSSSTVYLFSKYTIIHENIPFSNPPIYQYYLRYIFVLHLGDEGSSTIGICNLQDMTQLEIDPMTHNIDIISHTRDKVSLLLKCVRKNSFLDAQYIAQILIHILLDLLPSNQAMTTVIAEFLDQDQYNKPLIAWIMYKVSSYVFICYSFSRLLFLDDLRYKLLLHLHEYLDKLFEKWSLYVNLSCILSSPYDLAVNINIYIEIYGYCVLTEFDDYI